MALILAGLLGLPAACGWSADPPDEPNSCGRRDGVPLLRYEIVRTLPHDAGAYTQGLLASGHWLFESTGLYGESSVRKLELRTGREVSRQPLPSALFGEGLAMAGGRLYQLTWREGAVRIYRPDDLQLVAEARIDGEGWGLTFDGEHLVQSDGSATLYVRDARTLRVIRRLAVTAGTQAVSALNELEYADRRIWANIFQTTCIAAIDPGNGRVVGWLDIRDLARRARRLSDQAEVANGIAFDRRSGTYYVTGKRWPQLFEIRIDGLPHRPTRPDADRR